jgi:hypothetical protein
LALAKQKLSSTAHLLQSRKKFPKTKQKLQRKHSKTLAQQSSSANTRLFVALLVIGYSYRLITGGSLIARVKFATLFAEHLLRLWKVRKNRHKHIVKPAQTWYI